MGRQLAVCASVRRIVRRIPGSDPTGRPKITERTKGIIGVHLYGQPFDYAGVREIADRHGLFVVEDCAQAHGAQFEGKNVGTLGDLAGSSFYPQENLCFRRGSGRCYLSEGR